MGHKIVFFCYAQVDQGSGHANKVIKIAGYDIILTIALRWEILCNL